MANTSAAMPSTSARSRLTPNRSMRSSTDAPTIDGSAFSSAASSKLGVTGLPSPTIFASASALPPVAAARPLPVAPRAIVCIKVAV